VTQGVFRGLMWSRTGSSCEQCSSRGASTVIEKVCRNHARCRQIQCIRQGPEMVEEEEEDVPKAVKDVGMTLIVTTVSDMLA